MIDKIYTYLLVKQRFMCVFFFFGLLFFFSINSSGAVITVHFSDTVPRRYKPSLQKYSDTIDSVFIREFCLQHLFYLYSKGFLSAFIEGITRKGEDSIIVVIRKGRRYRWAKINSADIPAEILRRSNIRVSALTGRPVTPQRMSRIFDRLLGYYENHGYPFASVRLVDVTIDGPLISASLQCTSYNLFRYDTLVRKGTARITDNYLRHYLEIKKGGLYCQEIIDEGIPRLEQLSFVEQVRPMQTQFRKNAADVYLFLKNRKSNYFAGILGILPDVSNPGKVRFTGDLELSLLNGFGSGESVYFTWKKYESLTQRLNTGFNYPYIFKSAVGIDFKMELYRKDTSYLTVNPVYGLCIYNGGGNFYSLFIDRQVSSLISKSSLVIDSITLQPISSFRKTIYGLGTNQIHLNNRFNPLRGYSIIANAGFGRKIVAPADTAFVASKEFSQAEGKARINLFLPLSAHSTMRVGAQSGFLYLTFFSEYDSSDGFFYENEMMRIGGIHTLRGFDEDAILASVYSIFTLEYRYLFEKYSNLFMFCDVAYYEKQGMKFVHDTPVGFGAGINLDTKAGIFSLTWALGRQFSNPVELRSAKIHVGFVNRF